VNGIYYRFTTYIYIYPFFALLKILKDNDRSWDYTVDINNYLKALWMVAKSCATEKMVETLYPLVNLQKAIETMAHRNR